MSFLSIHAQDFLNSYRILRESNSALVDRQRGRNGKESSTMAYGALPAMGVDVVCLAFSVELHLKDLHRVVSNRIPKGHNIAKLFGALPAEIQEEVASHHSIARYGWDKAQFECELRAISDGFEKWRYAYENTSLRYNSYFAEVLIEASRYVSSMREREGVR